MGDMCNRGAHDCGSVSARRADFFEPPIMPRRPNGTESAMAFTRWPLPTCRNVLMDGEEFLAELEKFDGQPIPPVLVPRVEEPREEYEQAWVARPTFEDDESEPLAASSSAGWSAGRIALGVAGFLLMMCLGGAAAMLVFQDRVALILH